jgi:hypothetical protein
MDLAVVLIVIAVIAVGLYFGFKESVKDLGGEAEATPPAKTGLPIGRIAIAVLLGNLASAATLWVLYSIYTYLNAH